MPLIVNGKSPNNRSFLSRCFSLSDIARSFQSDECADVYDDTRVSFPEFPLVSYILDSISYIYRRKYSNVLIVGKEYEETTRERK